MTMSEEASQSMADRGENRSRQPQSSAFRDFIGSGWGPRPSELPERERVADFVADRTLKAGAPFPGERLVVPAGPYKVRSNDCDYRFRAHSAFAHLSGLGGEKEPDTVLVLEPNEDGTHTALLFFKPRASQIPSSCSSSTNARCSSLSLPGARSARGASSTRRSCSPSSPLRALSSSPAPCIHGHCARRASFSLLAPAPSLPGRVAPWPWTSVSASSP